MKKITDNAHNQWFICKEQGTGLPCYCVTVSVRDLDCTDSPIFVFMLATASDGTIKTDHQDCVWNIIIQQLS